MDPQEKSLFQAIFAAVVVLAGILLFFIYSILRQQRRYRVLALAKIRAEINTLETERQRLAADLHDEVGPLLSAIKLQINHLDTTIEADAILIEKSSKHIDEVIGKIREICNNLLPNILIRRGLIVAVEDFIEKVQSSTPTKIIFEPKIPSRLDLKTEINLYRIILEIIHNTIKHAQAKQLRIQLIKENNLIRLATEDNGLGFDANKILYKDSGHGILNLQSRAEVMSSEFIFDSKPGKGTRYLFEIPEK